jgi:hypothetical protein
VDFGCTAGTFFKGVSVFAEFNDFLASGADSKQAGMDMAVFSAFSTFKTAGHSRTVALTTVRMREAKNQDSNRKQ